MPIDVFVTESWAQAREILESLRPGFPISFGTGNPISRPYIQAVHLDADAGEGHGYRIAIKPLGDGYQHPAEYFLIYVVNRQTALNRSIYSQTAIDRQRQPVVSEACAQYMPAKIKGGRTGYVLQFQKNFLARFILAAS